MSFFRKKPKPIPGYRVDIHSHLIPGIDDGAKTLDDSMELLQEFVKLGYKKVITTPHIIRDFYPNNKESILGGLETLKKRISEDRLDIKVEAAAEHYLDEFLIDDINKDNILLFGGKYFLFETSFINKPAFLNEVIFAAKSKGLIPVLAHPERYAYLKETPELMEDLSERGLLFQINLISLSGYYSKSIKKMAEKLIDMNLVHFAGSDCHHLRHLEALESTQSSKYYKKLIELPLLNDSLYDIH